MNIELRLICVCGNDGCGVPFCITIRWKIPEMKNKILLTHRKFITNDQCNMILAFNLIYCGSAQRRRNRFWLLWIHFDVLFILFSYFFFVVVVVVNKCRNHTNSIMALVCWHPVGRKQPNKSTNVWNEELNFLLSPFCFSPLTFGVVCCTNWKEM